MMMAMMMITNAPFVKTFERIEETNYPANTDIARIIWIRGGLNLCSTNTIYVLNVAAKSISACSFKRYQSIAMLFLEWGADKESTAPPGPTGVGDILR